MASNKKLSRLKTAAPLSLSVGSFVRPYFIEHSPGLVSVTQYCVGFVSQHFNSVGVQDPPCEACLRYISARNNLFWQNIIQVCSTSVYFNDHRKDKREYFDVVIKTTLNQIFEKTGQY